MWYAPLITILGIVCFLIFISLGIIRIEEKLHTIQKELEKREEGK